MKTLFTMAALALVVNLSGQSLQPDGVGRKTTSGQMGSGTLAFLSEQPGTLFVDGLEVGEAGPGNVLTLPLTAGQHFVDVRDGTGRKQWEKTITVPAGSQIAERASMTLGIGHPQQGAVAESQSNQEKLYRFTTPEMLLAVFKEKAVPILPSSVTKDTINTSFGEMKYFISFSTNQKDTPDQYNTISYGFVLGAGANLDAVVTQQLLQFVNAYNDKSFLTRAYLHEDKLVLRMDIDLDGGVTAQFLSEMHTKWTVYMTVFNGRVTQAKK